MPVLKTVVEADIKARFRLMAKGRGLSESELLRAVILTATDERDPPKLSANIDEQDTETARMTVRMPRFLLESAAQRAKTKGMATSRWVTALVQSNLISQPVMTDAELNGLLMANRELAAIGRNLNQVARALNESFHETERIKLALLEDLQEMISNQRSAIRTLVRASQNAWVAENGAD